MPNYICIRTEVMETGEAKAELSHDLRLRVPGHLATEPNTWIQFYDTCNNVSQRITSEQARSDIESSRELLYQYIEDRAQEEIARNKEFKRHRGGKELKNTFVRGLLTFTPDGLVGVDQNVLDTAATDTLQKICEKLNVHPVYIAKHFDESTIHYHYIIEACDKDTGRSRACNLDDETCSALQDIGGECFKHLGFVRGEKKSVTGAKHLKLKQMHIREREELEQQLNALHSSVEAVQTELEGLHNECDMLDMQLTKQNVELAEKENKKKSLEEEKENIEKEIAALKDRLRRGRKTMDELSELTARERAEYNKWVSMTRKEIKEYKAALEERIKLDKELAATQQKLNAATQQYERTTKYLQIYGGAVGMAEELHQMKTYLDVKGYTEDYEDWAADYKEAQHEEEEQEEAYAWGYYDR